MARERDDDDRSGLGIGGLATVIGLVLGLLALGTIDHGPATSPTAGRTAATTTTADPPAPTATTPPAETTATPQSPTGDAGARAEDQLRACAALDRASGARAQCARELVTATRGALVDAISANPDPAAVASLWHAQAGAMAMGLGPGDDPSAVYEAGTLPAPAAGPSANTVSCRPQAGTRRNLRAPGTRNRPSALGVGVCAGDGAVVLVALFRNSGGYYADGVASRACTGARCAAQALSGSRCGRYRSYVVTYNATGQVAGPLADGWSPEQRYCNPAAA